MKSDFSSPQEVVISICFISCVVMNGKLEEISCRRACTNFLLFSKTITMIFFPLSHMIFKRSYHKLLCIIRVFCFLKPITETGKMCEKGVGACLLLPCLVYSFKGDEGLLHQWISLVMNLVDSYIVAQLYVSGVGCQEELLANSKPVAKCHLKR